MWVEAKKKKGGQGLNRLKARQIHQAWGGQKGEGTQFHVGYKLIPCVLADLFNVPGP